MASFGLMELLLMSVLQHAVHHHAALPHIEQGLSMVVSYLLQWWYVCVWDGGEGEVSQTQNMIHNGNIWGIALRV